MYSRLPLIWVLLCLLFGDRLLLYCSSTATVFSVSKQTRGRHLYFMYCLVDANWKPELPFPPSLFPHTQTLSSLCPPFLLPPPPFSGKTYRRMQEDIFRLTLMRRLTKWSVESMCCPGDCVHVYLLQACVHVYLSLPPLHITLPPYVAPRSHDLACIPFWPASHSNTFSRCIAVIPSYSKFLWVWWWA